MVAGVAHEINNPLAFVTNNVAVLQRDVIDLYELFRLYRQGELCLAEHRPDWQCASTSLFERADLDYTLENLDRLLDRSTEGLRRIQQIVKDLRLFARVDEGEWNEVDLNPGIESSVTMIQGYARKKDVRVVTDLAPMPMLTCYPGKMHQVVVNLLMNAIDACHRGR